MHAIQIPGLEQGGSVAILATGPSLTMEVAEGARMAYPCIAVTDAFLRAPWAKALYAHDALWWEVTHEAHGFRGLRLAGQPTPYAEHVPTPEETILVGPSHEVTLRNSGMAAVRIAAAAGAKYIHLYGFDCTPGHFHDRHKPPRAKPAPEVYEMWAVGLDALTAELARDGVEIVRHGPVHLPPLIIEGMRGLGDCIHQRGVVRPLSRGRQVVYVRTDWPQVYADMPRVKCLPRGSPRRDPMANVARSAHLFVPESQVPAIAAVKSCSYHPGHVRTHGSVLAAMGALTEVAPQDFRMQVPAAWCDAARERLPRGARFMVYRPLVERREAPMPARLPDPHAYASLFARARQAGFLVVAVANLEPGVEDLVGPAPDGIDLDLTYGELSTEHLIGLFAEAALIFAPAGFATVLGQAVGTPTVTVFGGFEDRRSFSAGAMHSPWLPIEPKRPCACWNPAHACDKEIDLEAANAQLERFLEEVDA